MEKHISLVGILNIVYSALALIGACALFIFAFGFRYFFEMISRYSHHEMDDVPPFVMDLVPFILTVIGIFILIFAIIGIIGAVGVLKRKEWGRIVVIVISFFNLIHIPLGTILGVYSIWALLNDENIRAFNPTAIAPAANPTIAP
jgi:hypothetical protein